LAFLLERLPTIIGANNIELDFLLEEGADGCEASHRVIHLMRKRPETRDFAKILASAALSFGERKRFAGLQASDALFFFARKLADSNPKMIDIPQESTLASVAKMSRAEPPVYHCRLDDNLLTGHKNDIEMMVQVRKAISSVGTNTEK
jgi:hypothetical protein